MSTVRRDQAGARTGTRIPRPRTTRAIRQALERGALILHADAGFGKTIALEDALDASGADTVWIRCTAADHDHYHLLLTILGAVTRSLPGTADVLSEAIAAGRGPAEPADVCRELLAELERLAPGRIVLVFDDAETLRASESATALLECLLEAADGRICVVISTRVALDLRRAKLRTAERLVEMDEGDLAFTYEECAQLLEHVRGSEPAGEDVDDLVRSAEGWPLGTALLAGSLGETRAGAGDPATAFPYLAEELLGRFDGEMRDAVIDSSVPPDLDDRMVRGLGLPPDFLAVATATLGIFLRPLADRPWASAYHPLLREFLLDLLMRERPLQRRQELNAAAARVLADAGRRLEAMQHWILAERWAEAAMVLTALDEAVVPMTNTPEALGQLLAGLPPEVQAEPAILLTRGMFEWAGCHYRTALPALVDATEAFAAAGDPIREWRARVLQVASLYELGEYEQTLAVADSASTNDPAAVSAPDVQMIAGIAEAALGRLDRALDRFRAAEEMPIAGAQQFIPGFQASGVDVVAGNFEQALERANASADALGPGDQIGMGPYVFGAFAHIHEVMGFDELALNALERGRAIADVQGGAGHVVPFLQMFLPGLLVRAGRVNDAEVELARAEAIGCQGWAAHDLEVTRALIAFVRGDHHAALRAATEAVRLAGRAPLQHQARAAIVLGRIAVWSGNAELAINTLDAVPVTEEQPGALAFLLTARSGAKWAAGDVEGALADLERSWHSVEEIHHVVRREWASVEPVLWLALERRVLEPVAVIAAVAAAGHGAELVGLTEHPEARVRRAAAVPVAESGHPDAAKRLQALEADEDRAVAEVARAARRRLLDSPPGLSFRLLGSFEARRGAYRIGLEAWNRPAAARFVRMLLLNRDEVLSEDTLFEAFWPGRAADAARRSLQVVVSRARAVLDTPGTENSVIESAGRLYRIRLRPTDLVDIDDFEATASAAVAERGPARRTLLERAEKMWRGEPLPEDRYASWAAPTRERLIDLYVGVLADLSELEARRGDWVAMVDLARRRLGFDPLDEAAHRDLILAYARSGRRGHALHQFLECRRALVDQLGVEPSAATAELHARVLAGASV